MGTDMRYYNLFRFIIRTGSKQLAKVAELVDALVLGTSGVTRESSSLSFRMKKLKVKY